MAVDHSHDFSICITLNARLGGREDSWYGCGDGEPGGGACFRGASFSAAGQGVEARCEAQAAVVLREGLGLVPGGVLDLLHSELDN